VDSTSSLHNVKPLIKGLSAIVEGVEGEKVVDFPGGA
jgi:hypothetical protein